MFEEWVSIISTLGFPIAVTVYLLWERRKHDQDFIEEIKTIIKSNTEALAGIKEVMKECKK